MENQNIEVIEKDIEVIEKNSEIPKIKLASIGRRVSAYVIDFIIFAMITIILMIAFQVDKMPYTFFAGDGTEEMKWIYIIMSIFVFLYVVTTNILLNGQTIGKWVARIRIVKKDCSQATSRNYILRALLRVFAIIIVLLFLTKIKEEGIYVLITLNNFIMTSVLITSFVLMNLDRNKRSISDRLAETVVIEDQK